MRAAEVRRGGRPGWFRAGPIRIMLAVNDPVQRIVERFALVPHPEGGYFKEVYRAALTVAHPGIPAALDGARPTGTLIYFLLERGDFSAWHRVRWTDEIWHLYAGGPLELNVIDATGAHSRRLLTTDLLVGEPTALVPAGCWQAARLGPGVDWAFGGCTVAPGFEFADFEMPRAAELKRQHPKLEAIIDELTRL